MGTTVLVTVAWRSRRRDLAVPADVAIADLLGPLAASLAAGRTHGHGLALAPRCGEPLPTDRSLEACGIVHGAVLVLIDGHPGAPQPSQAG